MQNGNNLNSVGYMYDIRVSLNVVSSLRQFIEEEARACSMEPALITPEYVCRTWGGKVSLEEIEAALKVVRGE